MTPCTNRKGLYGMKQWQRKVIACCAAMGMALGMSTMALAAEPTASTITVNGSGVVEAEPDLATIHVYAEQTADTAAQAQNAVNRVLSDITAAMKAEQVADEDIVTSYVSVYPVYRYDETTDTQQMDGYRAYTSIDITISDVEHAGKYVDAALQAGASGTDGVTFSLENPAAYYQQALQEAIKTAQTSAQAIAQAYGKPLGQVLSVTENSQSTTYAKSADYGVMEEASMVADTASGSNTTISYEDISVRASITAVYGF